MTSFLQGLIANAWQKKNVFFYLVLIPLSWLFALITALRRKAYQLGLLKSYALAVPVIVVGNINMGGSGKTPVVIWLAQQLKKNGFAPAVISRGYGGNVNAPTSVNINSAASVVGDEPVLIASRCDCPVWVGKNRVQVAAELLKAHSTCNVIISDDGLQHYRLKRDVEIAVVDADYSKDNARLLPAGPLREPLKRLKTVDAIIDHGAKISEGASQMQLVGQQFYHLQNPQLRAKPLDFSDKRVSAIAGIGKPERFFEYLRNLGIHFSGISFADHHVFTAEDLSVIECDVLIMTEKDAVKCKAFAQAHHWVLPVEAQMEEKLLPFIINKLAKR